jgi:hypothetical protein
MFGRGALATGGLSFAELKTLSLIKVAAKVADGHRIFATHPHWAAGL